MAGTIESYRGAVDPWECDTNGHMNVEFYIARFGDALRHLGTAIGMTPKLARRSGVALACRELRVRYRRELYAGDILALRSAVTGVGEGELVSRHELSDAASGEVSALAEIRELCVELESGAAAPWPEGTGARAEAMVAATALDPVPRLEPPPRSGPATGASFESGHGAVDPWECDAFGHMSPRFYAARASDCAAHMLFQLGLGRAVLEERRWGSTALEHHLGLRCQLFAGDVVTITTGFRAVGNKTFRFVHRFTDLESGEVTASIEVLSCLLDLERRKALVIPDEVRARIAERIAV